MYDEVFEEVEKLKLENEIVFTDFVIDSDLEVLYKNAALFVSVSLASSVMLTSQRGQILVKIHYVKAQNNIEIKITGKMN